MQEDMMGARMKNQQGLSFGNFLATVIVLVLIAISVMKVIPAYLQNRAIQTTFDQIAHKPEIKNIPLNEIKVEFNKRAIVSDITAIKVDDIDVTKDERGVTLSASYPVKIPLVGNASLLIEFNPSSSSSK